jgi:hypothetical protein
MIKKLHFSKRVALALLIAGGVVSTGSAHDIIPPCWRGQPGSTFQDWNFLTAANPASPESSSNPYGAPLVTVAPGPFSDGYFSTIPNSTNVGFWDLGQAGNMQCAIPNRPSNPSVSYKYIWVQVANFIGGPLDFATISIPNATLLGGQRVKIETIGTRGDAIWVDQTMWRLEPNPASETITITAPNNGSLIDEVVVDTWCVTNSGVYVDDNYASITNCGVVGWPNGSAPLDKYIGQNAFATIQLGITNAPTNGVVNVANGNYSGAVTVIKNLTLALGPDVTNATLNGNLTMTPGSSLPVDLNGLTAGSQYDQWSINGTVSLGGATLSVNDTVTMPLNSTFTIISNDLSDAVSGTFAGLPEGSVVTGNSQQFKLTYVGGSGNDVVLTLTNHLPVAVTDYAATTQDTPVVIPIVKLLVNDFDPDGDAFSFLSAFAPSVANGTVTFDSTTVTYTPPASFTGSNFFNYTIQDVRGGVGTGKVIVLVRPDGPTFNIISISTTNSGASFTITLSGIPGYTYSVQRATAVTGPWATVGSVFIPVGGVTTFYDPSPPPGIGFYRSAYP